LRYLLGCRFERGENSMSLRKVRSNPTIERDAREKAARAPHCER